MERACTTLTAGFVTGLLSLALGACREPDSGSPVPPADLAPTVAPELAFPSCADLSALWTSRYHDTLKADWPVVAIDCANPTAPSLERAFAETAYLLEKTSFRTAPVLDGYEAPPEDMLAFVTTKYLSLTIDADATYPSTDVENRVLHFYPSIAEEDGYSAIGNLIHEARHADGLQYLHVACTGGPNVGRSLCDEGLGDSFMAGGPHRIAALYFGWAAARSNWPKAKKDAVRAVAEWVVDQRVNASDEIRAAWKAKYLRDF